MTDLIERLEIAKCFLLGICAVRESPSSIESKDAVCDAIAALKAAPAEHDRPTCAGLWLVRSEFSCTVRRISVEMTVPASDGWSYYGPIPERT